MPVGGAPLPPGVTPPPIVPDTGDDGNGHPTAKPQTSAPSSTSPTSSASSSASCALLSFGLAAGKGDQVPLTPKWLTSHPTSSRPATTTASSSSTTKTTPPAQTVTANGQVCVLPYGSVDPYCTPISEPSPSQTPAPPAPTNYPGCDVPADGFSCGNNCRGYVACPAWCVANCAYCFNKYNVC